MGLMIGFVGVIVLFGEKIMSTFSTIGNSTELGALGLLVIGPIAWAGGSLYSKYKSTGGSAPVNTAWQMLVAGLAFIPGSLCAERHSIYNGRTFRPRLVFPVYLVFFGSIAAFSAYVWLLQVRSAIQVSTYAYVNPVVAVLLGIFLANEHISGIQILGLITILGSVLLINLSKYRKEKNKRFKKKIQGPLKCR